MIVGTKPDGIRFTVSPAPGTPAGVQFPGTLQFPLPPFQSFAVALTAVSNVADQKAVISAPMQHALRTQLRCRFRKWRAW